MAFHHSVKHFQEKKVLIEIHLLQNHAPSNLNRDDTGSPKECVFGGVKRARISSQCLKRTIRRSDLFQAEMIGHLATRTRRLPELIRTALEAKGLDTGMVEIAAKKSTGFGSKEAKEGDKFETAQTMFLTNADIQAIANTLYDAALAAKTPAAFSKVLAKDLQAQAKQVGFRPVSVDVALFGRMTTSEAFRDVQASAQVAHALSTHKVDHEFDYFTAVDDLLGTTEEEGDAGADMIGDVEYNSAMYYKYFSIDFKSLVDNLTGERSASRLDVSEETKLEAQLRAAMAVESLLKAAVLTTPSGKQNSFAAHQLPSAILIEARPYATPVSYANAFVEPARQGRDGNLVQASLKQFKSHVEAMTDGFNLKSSGRFLLAPGATLRGDGVIDIPFNIKDVENIADLDALCATLRETLNA